MTLTKDEVAQLKALVAVPCATVTHRELLALLEAHDENERLRAALKECAAFPKDEANVARAAAAALSGKGGAT